MELKNKKLSAIRKITLQVDKQRRNAEGMLQKKK